jgi:tellurite resistance protein TerC
MDNLFVLAVVLATFAVPSELQSRALAIGIALALVLRAALIAAGAALIAAFSVMFLIFGVALLITALQLVRHRAQTPAVETNAVIRIARRVVPLSDSYEGARMVIRVGARRMLTPLFLVLLAIASTDLLFAFDSIPAVFGVTQHPYIVFAANAFALLGMRALYLLVAGLLDRLVYLSIGLAAILAFIGVKLVLHFLHGELESVPEISTGASLAVIAVALLVTALASMRRSRRDRRVPAPPPCSQIHASPHWPAESGARSCAGERA